jgi:hypothetical protein
MLYVNALIRKMKRSFLTFFDACLQIKLHKRRKKNSLRERLWI